MSAILKFPLAVTSVFPATSDLYFPVEERELRLTDPKYPNGILLDNHKAIYRPDTEEYLGVVGKDYRIVPNEGLFQKLEEMFQRVIEPRYLEAVSVVDRQALGGAFCKREYHFPSFKVPVKQPLGGNETVISYRCFLWNSHDGSGAAKVATGAFDWICSNGMVFGEADIFKRKHTSGFEVPDFVEVIERSLVVFMERARQLQAWAAKELKDDEKVLEAIQKLPGVSDRLAGNLFSRYAQESQDRGPTLWALYSAMTFYASHDSGDFGIRQTGNDNVASTLNRRESNVVRWTNSEAFKKLAA